jgi:hypothetical protein
MESTTPACMRISTSGTKMMTGLHKEEFYSTRIDRKIMKTDRG